MLVPGRSGRRKRDWRFAELSAGGRWIRTSCSARDRSRRAAVQKTLGVAGQPFEQAQLVIEFGPGAGLPFGRLQASDDQAAERRLDVAAMRIIRPPDRPRRVSTGSTPRARIATPVQLFCPARPRRTDTRWAGPLFAPDLPEPTAQQGDDFLLNLRIASSRRNNVCLRASCCSALLISFSVLVRSSTVRLCPRFVSRASHCL